MRVKDERKRRAIHAATVAEVVAGGLAGASVAAIAARAGVSQGTIYLYHDDKEALLRAAYVEAKRTIHDALMAAAEGHATTADAVRAQWFALHRFVEDDPATFLFAEQAAAAGLVDDVADPDLARMAAETTGLIERGIEDGTFRPAPVAAIAAVLSAPAVQLARRRALGGTDPAVVEAVFSLAWRGVAFR